MTVEAMRRCVEAGGTLDDDEVLALLDAVEALREIAAVKHDGSSGDALWMLGIARAALAPFTETQT